MRDETGLFVVGRSYAAWGGGLWRINVTLDLVIDPCERYPRAALRGGGVW